MENIDVNTATFTCYYCTAPFISAWEVNQHCSRAHADLIPAYIESRPSMIFCFYCDASFYDTTLAVEHCNTYHPGTLLAFMQIRPNWAYTHDAPRSFDPEE